MEVTESTLVDNRYYTWALTPFQAVGQVKGYLGSLGQSAVQLAATYTGVIRPQGYDYAPSDFGTSDVETSPESLRRYRVDVT